jgi:hypothetical protein
MSPKNYVTKCNPILKPSKNGPDIIDAQEEIVLYVGLLEKVFQEPIFIVKSFKPQTRRDHMSKNQKSLQQHHILGCLAKWREANSFAPS